MAAFHTACSIQIALKQQHSSHVSFSRALIPRLHFSALEWPPAAFGPVYDPLSANHTKITACIMGLLDRAKSIANQIAHVKAFCALARVRRKDEMESLLENRCSRLGRTNTVAANCLN